MGKQNKSKDNLDDSIGTQIFVVTRGLFGKAFCAFVKKMWKNILALDFTGLLHCKVDSNSKENNYHVQAAIKRVWNHTNLLFKVGCFYGIINKFPMMTNITSSELNYSFANDVAKAESIVLDQIEAKNKMVDVAAIPISTKADARNEKVTLASETAIVATPDVSTPLHTQVDAIPALHTEVSTRRCCDFMRALPAKFWSEKNGKK